ncbi:MAG: SH3 domain-containing protein, partial [Chloroflexi bacterium]|nr:SH3 domain-containing protein [Chloroflexota bacterium]
STPVTPTPTTGPVFPVGSWVMVSSPDGRLNIRQGPGLGYAVVAVLNNGTRLRILGGPVPADSASWYEVTDEAGKVRGWCEGRYLVSTTPPATITPTIGPVFPVGSWVQVSSPSGRLNIRQGPGTNYAVIAVANNGTRLRIVGGPTVVGGVPWYEVVNDPQTYQGWCSGQYLTPVGPPPPTITPTSQPDFPPGTWVLVSSPDGQLNIRSGPGSQYSILRSVPNGTRLRVVQGPTWVEGAPWYLVTDEGQTFTGWCNGRYLVLAPVTPTSTVEPTFPVGTWVQVASPDGQLNIRSGPGPSYPVLYTAHNGDLLVIAGGPQWVSGDPWYNVSGPPGSTPGWCNGRYLVLAAPTPVPTQGPGAGQFTELQFCVIPPGGGEADCSGNFASPVYEVRIVWDYVNMQSGMTVRREWYFNGQHLNTVDEPWDYARYGAQGTVWDVRMWDNQGLDPGDYRLILYLNNVKQQERGFTIARR